MFKHNNMSRLQQQICELKLEERRASCDFKRLITSNQTIDFLQAKQLSSLKSGVKTKISFLESKINPNIIA